MLLDGEKLLGNIDILISPVIEGFLLAFGSLQFSVLCQGNDSFNIRRWGLHLSSFMAF